MTAIAKMKFPVTLFNALGGEYKVNSQEELDFHIVNGWSLEKQEPPPPVEDHASKCAKRHEEGLEKLDKRIQTLEGALDKCVAIETFSLLLEDVKKLRKEVFELQKVKK